MYRRPEIAAGDVDELGVARVREIRWEHPRLSPLSDAARVVYACLVDGCSTTARETLDAVDRVWRHRHWSRGWYASEASTPDALDDICLAVEELLAEGLLVLRDRSTIVTGWVMRPWESDPS